MDIYKVIEQGKQLTALGSYTEALEKFTAVLAVEPRNRLALFELGKVHYMLHQYDAAADVFMHLLQDGPNETVLSLLGKVFTENGKINEAIALYESARNQGLAGAELLRELGDLYKRRGTFEQAEIMYEKALEKDPLNTEVLFELVQLLNFSGKYESTIQAMNKYGNPAASGDKFSRNRLVNELEIAEKKTILDSKPRIMLVTLTSRCNLRCVMCGKGSIIWDISEKHKQEIITALPYLELITWQGGEVFLYPGFADMLDAARMHRHLHQIIITNGLLIDSAWAQKLIEQNQLDLTISIDSIERDRYEKLRPGSHYDTLINNVKHLTALREKTASTMFLTLRFTVMKENYTEMEDLVEFARELKFNAIILYPIDEQGGDIAVENVFVSHDPVVETAIQRAREAVHKKSALYGIRLMDWMPHPSSDTANITVNNGLPPPDKKLPLCFRPWKQIAMKVSGSMFPECLCTEPLGTIFKNSFEEVWNSENMQKYRKKMIADDYGWCCNPCITGDIPPDHLKFVCE
ncbi:MAG: tetratricopeptide repeat protein [Elusimicrobia bacterium]|nr:tetratricopeptide repeat protein [Elusimicrobiota bacterium]